MTNEQYRKARGTDKPFTATPAQSKKVWFAMNKDAIKTRRKRDKAWKGKRWSRIDLGDPGLYETDDGGED
ncbi:MAG TPA: hypothetical protein PLF11_11010 [Bacillota bacterium]|nr:hypothetical protein [Bacillota bacterium]